MDLRAAVTRFMPKVAHWLDRDTAERITKAEFIYELLASIAAILEVLGGS